MSRVIELESYRIRKARRDRIKLIRETVLEVTGRRLSDDEIADIYQDEDLYKETGAGKAPVVVPHQNPTKRG